MRSREDELLASDRYYTAGNTFFFCSCISGAELCAGFDWWGQNRRVTGSTREMVPYVKAVRAPTLYMYLRSNSKILSTEAKLRSLVYALLRNVY